MEKQTQLLVPNISDNINVEVRRIIKSIMKDLYKDKTYPDDELYQQIRSANTYMSLLEKKFLTEEQIRDVKHILTSTTIVIHILCLKYIRHGILKKSVDNESFYYNDDRSCVGTMLHEEYMNEFNVIETSNDIIPDILAPLHIRKIILIDDVDLQYIYFGSGV